jgi:hypothetical protein
VTDVYGLYHAVNEAANFVSFNISVLIETTLLLLFFAQIFSHPLAKKIIVTVLFFLLVFWLYHFYRNGNRLFLFNAVILENTCVLIISLCYYYEQLVKLNVSYNYPRRRFWVVSSYFVYVSGTFVLFLYVPSLSSPEFLLKYLNVNSLFIILRSLLLSIAFAMKNNDPDNKGLN